MAKYVLAMGGYNNTYSDKIDVFEVVEDKVVRRDDIKLQLSSARYSLGVACCGDYILAMGGFKNGSSVSTVDVFKITNNGIEEVKEHGLALSRVADDLGVAVCGNYILAMGGDEINVMDMQSDVVNVFEVTADGVIKRSDLNLTLSTGGRCSAACVGQYVLAVTTNSGSHGSTIDVFKCSETGIEKIESHGLEISNEEHHPTAVGCGNYVLVMGGSTYSGSTQDSDMVYVFKATGSGFESVKDFGLRLSKPRQDVTAVSCDNYIFAMGGRSTDSNTYNTIDVFKVTADGVEKLEDDIVKLSVARSGMAAASIGDMVFAMGGYRGTYSNSQAVSVVDVFKVF